jgi:hypothetical protein
MLNFIGAAHAADTLIFKLSTEHFIQAAIAGLWIRQSQPK